MERQQKKQNKFLYYLSPHWGLFLTGMITMLLVSASKLAGPLVLRRLIDDAIPNKDITKMIICGVTYFGLVLIMGLLTWFQSISIAKLGLNIVTSIKRDLFSHMLTLPVSYFDKHPVGELMARVENDTEKIKQLFSETGITLISNIIYFVGMFIIFFNLDASVAWKIIIPTPILLFLFVFAFDKLTPIYKNIRKRFAEICSISTEFVQGIEIVQAFNRSEFAAKKLEKASKEKLNSEVKASLTEYAAIGFLEFLGGPMLILLIIKLTAPKVLIGTLTIGTLLVFIEYGLRLFEPLISIGENIRGIQQSKVSLKRIFDIFALESELKNTNEKALFKDTIKFENVSFYYKENEPVLDNVSFEIKKGQTTALVGPSGSGKTTAVSLLCRFYNVTQGKITVDGKNINSFDLYDWRRKIGLVLQDIYLFPGSIMENVRIYDNELSETDIMNALKTAQADSFVKKLPEGINTILHERGSNLSMGEKQLLSFARAIIFGAEIIIMDEATASIDVTTEKRIQESMDNLLKDRTALIVAHRLSSILKADNIIFFADGKIKAQGKHDVLMRTLPDYKELVRLQFPDLETLEAV